VLAAEVGNRSQRRGLELPGPAILLYRQTELPLKIPGQRITVDRARRLDPAVDRALVHGPPPAVVPGLDRVEDHAVGVKLRVVVAAAAVLEHRRHEIRRQNPNLPIAVANAGEAAMAEHRRRVRH